jgi:predicted ATP-grasp superfamily ATP-dependent carboligase
MLVLPRNDYPHGFPDVARRFPGIPRVYTGGLENHPNVLVQLAQSGPLWGNPHIVTNRVRDPIYLKRQCSIVGVRFPETKSEATNLPTDGSWLVKPLRSSGGLGIRPWLGGKPPAECVFQKIVHGESRSLIVAMIQGKAHLVGVTRQLVHVPWLHAPPFSYCGSIPVPLDESQSSRLDGIMKLVELLRLRGLVNVDYVDDGDAVTLLEINPRWSASMEVFDDGSASLFSWHVQDFVPSGNRWMTPPIPRCAKAILFAPADLSIVEAPHFPDGEHLADIPVIGTSIRRGDPVVSLRVPVGSIDETLLRLQSLAEDVKARLWTPELRAVE